MMADMEKLLDGLHCRATNFPEKDCAHCYYGIQMGRRWGCDFRRMAEDALALLKAQEPLDVDEWPDEFLCPTCKTRLARRSHDDCVLLDTNDTPNFCWVCGQAVKWE